MTNTVNRLMQAGYIMERKSDAHGCGRTPGILELNAADNYVLGVDVNDAGLTACVMNLRGEALSEHAASADFPSPKALMQSILAFSNSRWRYIRESASSPSAFPCRASLIRRRAH